MVLRRTLLRGSRYFWFYSFIFDVKHNYKASCCVYTSTSWTTDQRTRSGVEGYSLDVDPDWLISSWCLLLSREVTRKTVTGINLKRNVQKYRKITYIRLFFFIKYFQNGTTGKPEAWMHVKRKLSKSKSLPVNFFFTLISDIHVRYGTGDINRSL